MGGQEAEITVGSVTLRGTLNIPDGATGLVLFVHGSGSSRFSSRNRFVAQTLVDAGLATLVFDLLSEEEEQVDQYTAQLRFDIGLLTQRVVAVTSWLRADEHSRGLALGLCAGQPVDRFHRRGPERGGAAQNLAQNHTRRFDKIARSPVDEAPRAFTQAWAAYGVFD